MKSIEQRDRCTKPVGGDQQCVRFYLLDFPLMGDFVYPLMMIGTEYVFLCTQHVPSTARGKR